MIVIDKLCYGSGLRFVNASEKAAYAILGLAVCVAGRSLLAAALLFFVNGVLTVGKGGIPLSRYVRLLAVPFVFLVVGTAAVMVNISRTALDLFAIPVGSWYVTGSVSSVSQGLGLAVTAMGAVSCLYFLALSTPVTDFLGVLERLRFPAFLIELMLLVYRFIFLLMETADSVMTAQDSRLGNKDFRTAVRSFGEMASAVFLLSIKRSGMLYDAMESRCYDGRLRVLSEERPGRRGEVAMIAAFLLLLLIITVLEKRWLV